MSSFNALKETVLGINPTNDIKENTTDISQNSDPFDIKLFAKELYDKSEAKNRAYSEISNTINAYDVAHNCIRDVLYRIRNTPVESFANKWLPILMRSFIGSAVHEFIQMSDQFTENEVILKVPSVKFSGRLDCLIGSNILVEIKSCPYSDYKKLIKTRTPRIGDFLQTLTYKIMLEDYLQEIKQQPVTRKGTSLPSLDIYDIKQIQYIYVAHDIVSSDIESMSEALKLITDVKKMLNSKKDSFFFISSLLMSLADVDISQHVEYIKNKIAAINYYLDTNTVPGQNDPYVDQKKCFFCLYKQVCEISV